MCYPKPGPRCSAHASKKLAEAKLQVKVGKYEDYRILRDAVEEAEKIYDATPTGIAELERRVRDNQNPVHIARLELGKATRKMQLDALKTVDKGDVQHDESFDEVMYSTKGFLPGKKVRKAFDIKGEDMDKLLEDSHSWISSLTTEEIEAVAWYTSNGAGSINSYIMTGEDDSPFPYSKEHLEKYKNLMDSALAKRQRSTPVIVYRGVSHDTLTNLVSNETVKSKDAFKVGDKFSSPTFMSASLDPAIAAGYTNKVVMEIKSYTAGAAVNVSAWDITEKEMILPRNKEYRVVNIIPEVGFENRGGEKVQRRMVVQLEEVLP